MNDDKGLITSVFKSNGRAVEVGANLHYWANGEEIHVHAQIRS